MTTATAKTFDHRLRIGTLMTVWRVTYTWHEASRGCPPSHWHGATPDEPAHAEIESAVLVHLGGGQVADAAWYSDNQTVYRNSRDGDYAWGDSLWSLIEETYAERVMESERLQREIAKHEDKSFGIE